MKKKILSIFVCMLLCVTVTSVTGTLNNEIEEAKEIKWLNVSGSTGNPNANILTSEDWLHFDNGESANALGLTSGGTFEWAARFTPTELGAWGGSQISAVQYHHDWTSGPFAMDGTVKIYGEGTSSQAGDLITSEDFEAYENDWTLIYLSDPVTIAGDEDLWVSIEGTHAAGQYPAGMDPGPAVDGKGDWLYLSGSGWQEAQGLGFDANFNIWAGIGVGNSAPDTPPEPNGPDEGVTAVEYTFTTDTTDPDGDLIYYKFDWGDGTDSGWVGPYGSGITASASKMWTTGGDYDVKVIAKDESDAESGWSPIHEISIVEGPQLEIGNIVGGLFKVSAPIRNIGAVDATDVSWTITLEGGAFIGKESTGTETIYSGGEKTVSSKFILGFGKTKVTVKADVSAGVSDEKSQNGNIYLFFIVVRPGGG